MKQWYEELFTELSVLFPLYHSVKDFINANSDVKSEKNNFDLMTFRDFSTVQITDDNGKPKTLNCDERYYAPSEITWLLESQNFKTIAICGCGIGDFNRNNRLRQSWYQKQ